MAPNAKKEIIYKFLGSIKQPGLDNLKTPLLNDQYVLNFLNSRSLERPGLIIESLEYVTWAK